MGLQALHEEVNATLTRLKSKHPELKPALEKSVGYVVFPSMGRASAVLGGAYGRGEVFENGNPVGFASLGQLTIGVQVGGQTFSEVVFFKSRNALDRFKQGRIAFTANASAVIVRAAASGTIDYEKDVTAKAFARGGMLLELSIGGQSFKFIPPKAVKEAPKAERATEGGESAEQEAKGHEGEESAQASEESGETAEAHEGEELAEPGRAGRAARTLIDKAQGASSKVSGFFRSHSQRTE
jgi:hypothetical protein